MKSEIELKDQQILLLVNMLSRVLEAIENYPEVKVSWFNLDIQNWWKQNKISKNIADRRVVVEQKIFTDAEERN